MFGMRPGRGGLGGGMRTFRTGTRGSRNPYAVILALRLLQQIANLPRKPPLTLALIGGMCALHLKPDLFEDFLIGATGFFDWGWLAGGFDHVRSVCLLPAAMLDTYERTGSLDVRRLLLSAFVHGDDMHLYYNMASFLLKGVSLELAMGTPAYSFLLAFTLVASQTLLLLSSWLLLVVFEVAAPMKTCTVGFSGVLFALKYLLARRSPGTTTVMGFKVHTRYAAWLELVLISVLVPKASFLGHACGILAGILYTEVPEVLRVLSLVTGISLLAPAQSYTYSSGPAGQSGASEGRPSRTPNSAERSPHDRVHRVDTAEEAAIQEALRRSMHDTGPNRTGRGWAGRGTSSPDLVEAHREQPSAPPAEDVPGAYLGSTDVVDASELRRRRLQRLDAR